MNIRFAILIEYSTQSLQAPRIYTNKRKAREAFDGRLEQLGMTVKNGAVLALRTQHVEIWQMGNTAVGIFAVQLSSEGS